MHEMMKFRDNEVLGKRMFRNKNQNSPVGICGNWLILRNPDLALVIGKTLYRMYYRREGFV